MCIRDSYNAVIPDENPLTLTTNKTEMLNNIKAASIATNKNTNQISLYLTEGKVYFKSVNQPESKTVHAPLKSAKYSGEEVSIGFNDEYLKDEDFNLFKKYDFVPNSLFILIVGPNSYHSLPVIKNADLNRKTISLSLNHQIPRSAFKSLRVRNKKFKNQKKGDYLSHKNYSLNRSKKRFGFF